MLQIVAIMCIHTYTHIFTHTHTHTYTHTNTHAKAGGQLMTQIGHLMVLLLGQIRQGVCDRGSISAAERAGCNTVGSCGASEQVALLTQYLDAAVDVRYCLDERLGRHIAGALTMQAEGYLIKVRDTKC